MIDECHLPYNNSFLKVALPPGDTIDILKSRHVKGFINPVEAIKKSLRTPLGSPPMIDCLQSGDKVVVIVTDNTRPCPDDILLPPILAEIEQKIAPENITIIIALGLHAPLSNDELDKKLGSNIVAKYNVVNHDPSQTVDIGTTSRGIPVSINRKVVEANFRISTGFIEPHFFAGFSGGRKSIFPGVSGSKSIRSNHSFDMIDHPLARAGILKGNPVHEDMLEHARIAKLNFIVNVILNDRKEISHVIAGDPFTAHERGCEIEKDIAGVKVRHEYDIVITTNSGAPLDMDFYQTCKGIENASRIVRDGGIIIIASGCSAGIGHETFRMLHMSTDTPQALLGKIKKGGHFGVQWQNQILARVQVKNDVYLVSELEDNLAREMKVSPFPTVEAALQKALGVMGNNEKIAIIPDGPMVLPFLED